MTTKLNIALIALTAAFFSFASTANAQAVLRVKVIAKGMLDEGQSRTHTVQLNRGQSMNYRAIADRNAQKVIVRVYAPSGPLRVKYTMDDRSPLATFRADYTGEFKIRVTMHDTRSGVPSAYSLVSERWE